MAANEVENDIASQQQQHPLSQCNTVPAGQPRPRPQKWNAVRHAFTDSRGPEQPPASHVQLNKVAFRRQDLTNLYGSAPYPPLDYGDSFARASMPLLPQNVRREVEALHPTLRHRHAAPNPLHNQALQAATPVSGQASVRRPGPVRFVVSCPEPNPLAGVGFVPQAPGQPPVGPVRVKKETSETPLMTAPPLSAAPITNAANPASNNNRAPTNNPAAASNNPAHSSTAHNCPSIPSQSLTAAANYNISISTPGTYFHGTGPIPQPILDVMAQIQAAKKNANGFPTRRALKEIPEHFTRTKGTLRKRSWLWGWYGDTRLLGRREWVYLVSEGTGGEIE